MNSFIKSIYGLYWKLKTKPETVQDYKRKEDLGWKMINKNMYRLMYGPVEHPGWVSLIMTECAC